MKTRAYLDANILITAFQGRDQKIIKVHVFFMKGGAYFLTIFRYCTIIDISLCDSHNILVRPNLQLLQTQHGCNWLRMSRYDTLFSDSYQPYFAKSTILNTADNMVMTIAPTTIPSTKINNGSANATIRAVCCLT